MFEKHKQPSLEAGLTIILIVLSMFSFAFFTENRINCMEFADIIQKYGGIR